MPVRLFVGNLPYDATEDDIRTHFSTAGNVLNVFLPLDRETGRKRGFAFVEFSESAEAQEAIRLFNSQPFRGRPLAVNEARAKEARPPMAGGGGPGSGGGFRPGPRPAPPGGGYRPGGHSGPPPGRPPGMGGFGGPPDAGALDPGRSDKANRRFGPDAKPFRNRSQKAFRPEGGKRTFKEKSSGQLYSMDDDGTEVVNESEIDNFAQAADPDDQE